MTVRSSTFQFCYKCFSNAFQARANQIVSCVVTIRVMRELCHRVPAFKPLSNWAIELLCEKSLSSSFQPLGPGEAFRRVLEAIASGIFLPGKIFIRFLNVYALKFGKICYLAEGIVTSDNYRTPREFLLRNLRRNPIV